MLGRSRLGVLVSVAVFFAACGGETTSEEVVEGSQATSTSIDTPSTTVQATTTTTMAVTTTTEGAPACDDAEISADAEMGEVYEIDVDGDGATDTVTTFFDGASNNYGLLVEYAAGGSARLDRPVFAVRQEPVPIGVFDFNEDGVMELLFLEYALDQGISYEPGVFNGVFVAQNQGCELVITSFADRPDDPRGFGTSLGTYPPQGALVECRPDSMVIYDFYTETQDGSSFNVSVITATLSDGLWTFSDHTSEEVPKEEMLNMPLFDCGDLEVPAPRPAQ